MGGETVADESSRGDSKIRGGGGWVGIIERPAGGNNPLVRSLSVPVMCIMFLQVLNLLYPTTRMDTKNGHPLLHSYTHAPFSILPSLACI